MSLRLPPLKALRAFEAAARHLSMKEAAAELHVTPGAISQLVKSLEDHLGVALFRRLNRALVLTPEGQRYLPPIRAAFRQIGEATARVRAADGAATLTVSAAPAFAATFLVPRLRRFRERHPGTELRVLTTDALADFRRDGVDAAIRHGLGRYPGLASWRVLTVEMAPVCAPRLLPGEAPAQQPEALLDLPLLHDEHRQDWTLWFEAQGVAVDRVLSGPSLDDEALLLDAAVAGEGVALVPIAMARPYLDNGRLSLAYRGQWPRDFAYWLVCPQEAADRPGVRALREWLVEEAREPTGMGSE